MTCALARAKRNYDLKIAPKQDTGQVEVECRECGKTFKYVKTTGRRRFWCSTECKYKASEAAKRGRAPSTTRACACGSADVKRVGKPVCPECKVDRRDPVLEAAKERRRTLRKYGLTQDDWDELVERQGDRCAICRTGTPGGRGQLWHIDHDHTNGDVRGLLCHHCNVGIGNFQDDPKLLLAAIHYIEAARSRTA